MLLGACPRAEPEPSGPQVAGEPIEPRVVALVAEQHGLDPAAARAHVVETLRWVAAAGGEQGDGGPELTEERRTHLRRAALARLWLKTEFEPTHGPAQIPADDPALIRARTQPRFVHPELHEVCQVILVPADADTPEVAEQRSANPAWRARAQAQMAPLSRHLQRIIPPTDPGACDLFVQLAQFTERRGDDIEVRIERPGGYDLDACAALDAAGECTSPRFAPEWTGVIRDGPVPGFREPFFTRFGLHLALVTQVLPAVGPEDPTFDQTIRAAVHPQWQHKALLETLDRLRTERGVLVAKPQDGEP